MIRRKVCVCVCVRGGEGRMRKRVKFHLDLKDEG